MRFLKYFFNPFLFPLAFLAGYILYLMNLAPLSLKPPAFQTTVYVFLGMLCYIGGACSGIYFNHRVVPAYPGGVTVFTGYSKKGILPVWLVYTVSILFFLFEHVIFYLKNGSIPILNPRYEILRFEFPVNGYIHLIAMMNYTMLFCIIAEYLFYRKGRTSSGYRYLIYSAVLISVLLGLALGHRGILLNFIVFVIIANSFRRSFKIKTLFLWGGVGLYLFGMMKLIRDYFFYGEDVFRTIGKDWVFGDGMLTAPLYFTYLGVTMNFSMLNSYVIHLHSHFNGYFSILLPFLSLLPGKEYSLQQLQYDVLYIDFHGTLTPTMLAVPYIDFNILGVLVIFILGAVCGFMYANAVRFRLLRYIIPYAYFFWMIMLGLYTYMFNEFYVLLNIGVLFFLSAFIDKRLSSGETSVLVKNV